MEQQWSAPPHLDECPPIHYASRKGRCGGPRGLAGTAVAMQPPPSPVQPSRAINRLAQCPWSCSLTVGYPSPVLLQQLTAKSSAKRLRADVDDDSVPTNTNPEVRHEPSPLLDSNQSPLLTLQFPCWPSTTLGEIALRAVRGCWDSLIEEYEARRDSARALVLEAAGAPLSESHTSKKTTELGGDGAAGLVDIADDAPPHVEDGTAGEHEGKNDVVVQADGGRGGVPPPLDGQPPAERGGNLNEKIFLPKTLSVAVHAIMVRQAQQKAQVCGEPAASSSSSILSAPPPFSHLGNVSFTRVSLPRAAPIESADEQQQQLPSPVPSADVSSGVLVLRRDQEVGKVPLSAFPAAAAPGAAVLCVSIHSMHW